MQQLLSGAISELEACFSSFELIEILKASRVFSPSTWPFDPSALARFGYDEIQLLQSNYLSTVDTLQMVVLMSGQS